MPHYFFDVENGQVSRDYVGRDLASLQAAKKEADRTLSDAVRDQCAPGVRRDIAIHVRDEASVVVLRVCLSYSVTPPVA